MADTTLKARFMTEPRFAKIDGKKFPVLLTPYLDGGYYEEDFGAVDAAFYDEFCQLIKADLVVLLARVDRDGAYHPVALHKVKSPSFTSSLACNIGERVAKVVEK